MAKEQCGQELVPAVGHGTEKWRMKEIVFKKKWRWWGEQSPANTIERYWKCVVDQVLMAFRGNFPTIDVHETLRRLKKIIARCCWKCWFRQGPRAHMLPIFWSVGSHHPSLQQEVHVLSAIVSGQQSHHLPSVLGDPTIPMGYPQFYGFKATSTMPGMHVEQLRLEGRDSIHGLQQNNCST